MVNLISYLILISSIVLAKVDTECLRWFQDSKINPYDVGCVLKCSALATNLDSFQCPNSCSELCKKQDKCYFDTFWKQKIKNSRPMKWDFNTEKTAAWAQVESDQVVKVLSGLPEELKRFSFDGFYRMQKSVAIINPATTSLRGDVIVIYDRAFNNPFWALEEVVLHEMGHVAFLNLNEAERRSFKNQMGWKQSLSGDSFRKGEFVSSRAKDSPEEDFSESFIFFLKDSESLKAKNSKAYEWFIKKYSVNFKYKKDCENEKK